MTGLVAFAGRYVTEPKLGIASRRFLARPFKRKGGARFAVLYEVNRISYAQIFPFVQYADEIEKRFGVQLRFFDVAQAERLDFSRFDTILLQLWFDRDQATFERIFLKARSASVPIKGFIDSFAHNDLRLAETLGDEIDFYLKKSLLRDRTGYSKTTLGDTNLVDYYSRLYGLQDIETTWSIPDGFLDKLRLTPNFFMDPFLSKQFEKQNIETVLAQPRDIDLHARLASKGSPWYSNMRQHAERAVDELSGLNIAAKGRVTPKQYNQEMMRSRMCFSPFGYGELCWRDVEATAFGSVLLKPSMSHLETAPDIYEPGVTYVPVAWDFSDLDEKVDWVLSNSEEAKHIVRNAFTKIRTYQQSVGFLDDMKFLFVE